MVKILEIGPYPPPNTGWSVRIKFLKKAFTVCGVECQILNIGKNRKIKKPDYIDVQSGFDYFMKLYKLSRKGYCFHLHANAQAIKGPIITLVASIGSILFQGRRSALTFHGGMKQLYFPHYNFKIECIIIYTIFLISKVIICNDENIKTGIVNYGPAIKSAKIFPIPAFSSQYIKFTETPIPNKIEMFLSKNKYNILTYMALREGYYIDTFIEYLKIIRQNIGIVVTGIKHVEDRQIGYYYKKLLEFERKGLIFIVENLEHECFLTILKRCDLYLRTYISDGVSSSVLEALSIGTTVVACENGNRPESVITYKAEDAYDLQEKVEKALSGNFKRKRKQKKEKDTLKEEVETLIKIFSKKKDKNIYN